MFLTDKKEHQNIEQLERALRLIANWHNPVWQDNKKLSRIRLNNILAVPWNSGRIERCLRLSKEGTFAPPINAVGLQMPNKKIYYSLGDGHARTCAARILKKTRISAIVQAVYPVEPSRYCLEALPECYEPAKNLSPYSLLQRPSDPLESWYTVVDYVDNDMALLLASLGVKII